MSKFLFFASSAFFHLYIVTESVKLVNKMKQFNSMTILFLLSFCISFVLAASVPILHDDYGKYPVSKISISTIPNLTQF